MRRQSAATLAISFLLASATAACSTDNVVSGDASTDAALDAGRAFTTNWGACATACLPVCNGDAAVTTPVSDPNIFAGIALASGQVYWCDSSTVLATPTSGGAVTTVATVDAGASQYFNGIAVDPTNVYWTTIAYAPDGGAYGGVAKAALDGGSTTPLASFAYYSSGPQVDATSVYWLAYGPTPIYADSAIMRVPIDGGDAVEVVSGVGQILSFLVDGANLFFAAPGAVMQMPLDGGAITTLASGTWSVPSIAVDATNVYFVEAISATSAQQAYPDAILMTVPKGGGAPVPLAEVYASMSNLVVDSTSVYWIATGSPPYPTLIQKVPIAGGDVTVLSCTGTLTWVLADDATSLFWLDPGVGVSKLTPK